VLQLVRITMYQVWKCVKDRMGTGRPGMVHDAWEIQKCCVCIALVLGPMLSGLHLEAESRKKVHKKPYKRGPCTAV
jgi:hypothetical protein